MKLGQVSGVFLLECLRGADCTSEFTTPGRSKTGMSSSLWIDARPAMTQMHADFFQTFSLRIHIHVVLIVTKNISRKIFFLVRFEVLTAANMKMSVFCFVASCSVVEVYRRFRGIQIYLSDSVF